MKKHKLNIVLSMILTGLSAVALSGCSEWDKKSPDENTTEEVAQNSNAILEPIKLVSKGYDYIKVKTSGVDEDGIDHVDVYVLHHSKVVKKHSHKLKGDVSFDFTETFRPLVENTSYEVRTVCYSVEGKTKSIEKNSVKTFTKTPNDPSNDTTADTQKPVITLNGASTLTLTVGDIYTEQGATVTDNVDTGLTATIGGDTVDTSTAGTYVVTYSAIDSAGNVADVLSRTVIVEALPAQNLTITTSSWGIISWANSDNIVADNWSSNVVTDLTINFPYMLSINQFTFSPQVWWSSETKTTNILHNGQVVGTKSITVTWQ